MVGLDDLRIIKVGKVLCDSHSISRQPVLGLDTQTLKIFLCLTETSCFSARAHCLISCHRAPLKRGWLCLLDTTPPPKSGIYKHTGTILLSILFSRLSSPSFLSLSIYERVSSYHHGLLLNSFQYVHVSLVLESPELDTVLQMGPHQCSVEGKDHLP